MQAFLKPPWRKEPPLSERTSAKSQEKEQENLFNLHSANKETPHPHPLIFLSQRKDLRLKPAI